MEPKGRVRLSWLPWARDSSADAFAAREVARAWEPEGLPLDHPRKVISDEDIYGPAAHVRFKKTHSTDCLFPLQNSRCAVGSGFLVVLMAFATLVALVDGLEDSILSRQPDLALEHTRRGQ